MRRNAPIRFEIITLLSLQINKQEILNIFMIMLSMHN